MIAIMVTGSINMLRKSNMGNSVKQSWLQCYLLFLCRFIDELKRRGTSAFPAFIASIDKTQVDLKRKLNKSCEALLEDVPASESYKCLKQEGEQEGIVWEALFYEFVILRKISVVIFFQTCDIYIRKHSQDFKL